jgi:hypothetical protein
MALCTKDDVRKLTKKINVTDVADDDIDSFILTATNIVYTDLSKIATQAQLENVSNSLALNLLCSYKTCELILASFYGAGRKIDEITDIQFFQKLYDKLLNNILNGNVKLFPIGVVNKNYPALEKKRAKLYNVKGEKDFFGDGGYSKIDIEVDE